MSLASLKDVLPLAYKHSYAVAGFVVLGWEDARAYTEAGQAEDSAVILQAGPKCRQNMPLPVIASMFRHLAEDHDVPVVAHLDHGYSEQECYEAMDQGFSSVMFDGSALPIDENILTTARIVERAKVYSVSVEAELGIVGYAGGKISRTTDPGQAGKFVQNTLVDALAISVGNTHLQTSCDAVIDMAQLADIEAQTRIPLVIHGGSGIAPELRRRLATSSQICKFNIGTELRKVFGQSLRQSLSDHPGWFDRIEILQSTEVALKESARKIIRNLNPDGEISSGN